MTIQERDLSQQEIQAFPPWLDLPPGYIVNDWIAWQKGKLVARRLREDPSLVQVAVDRLLAKRDALFGAEREWLNLLQSSSIPEVASLLEAPTDEGQRLRSSTPFARAPFVLPEEAEAIRERAYVG